MGARVKHRLLITARDMGSHGHIQAILDAALRDSRFEVCVYAAEPALARLRRDHAFVRPFGLEAITQPSPEQAERLIAQARGIVDAERPDAILVGVSHFHESGVDEAFLAAARDRPRFAMQDFWGDANLNLGGGADLYFALDEAAVRLTRARHNLAAKALGSPKHARYGALDVAALRARTRAEGGIASGRLVGGYFGQGLARLPGYHATVRAFAKAFAGTGAELVYKPHPRESAADADATRAIFAAEGIAVYEARGETEAWLAAVDAVFCCFSTCAYDAMFLYRDAGAPVGTATYLLFDDEIARYFRDAAGLDVPPPAELGVVGCVRDRAALDEALRAALSPQGRQRAWDAARRHLPDPRGAAQAMLDEVAATLARRESR